MAKLERQMQMDSQADKMDRIRQDLKTQLTNMDQEKWSQFAKGIVESGLELGSCAVSLGGAVKGLKDMAGTVDRQQANIINTKSAAVAGDITNGSSTTQANVQTATEALSAPGVSTATRAQAEQLIDTTNDTIGRAGQAGAGARTALDCNNESILIKAESDLHNAKFQEWMAIGGLIKAGGPMGGSIASVYATEDHMKVTSEEVDRDLHGTHRQMAAENVSNLDQFKSWVTSTIESFSRSSQDNVKASADRM
jgi:hypothetical protein